jgi:tetratricopeptide (TPR) repeat protein
MAEDPKESSPYPDEIRPEDATQEILLSEEEPDEELFRSPPLVLSISSIRDLLSNAGASVVDFLRSVGGSNVGLSITVGIFAAFVTAIGFAVFDSGREQWMLEQKYPDATSSDERYVLYARDLMDGQQYSKAESILQGLIERSGEDGAYVDAQFLLGKCLLASTADEDSAKAGRMVLDRFAERFPTDPRVPGVYRLVAENLADNELYDDSTVRYGRLLRMLPHGRGKGEIEFLIAKNHYESDNLVAAVMALRALRQNYAKTTIAHDSSILLAKTMLKNDRFDRADTLLRELVQQAPRTAHAGEAMLVLAETAAERGEYDHVIDYCEDWFKHSPISQDELDIMLLLARAKLETGALEEAISLASEILISYRHSPRLSEADMLMGRAYEALNDLETAEGYYLGAIAADPNNWEPRWRLARLRTLESKWPEAIELMEQAVGIAPNEDFLLLELTKLYRLNGDEAGAFSVLGTFTRERQLSLQIDEAYLLLADIHSDRGALQDAYRSLERLEAIGATTTDLAVVYDRQGDVLDASGLHSEAVEKYRMAVEKGASSEAQKLKIARSLLADEKAQECLDELAGTELALQPLEMRFDVFEIRANAFMTLERYAEARAEMIKAISQRSGREKYSTLASLMQANLKLKDENAASEIFELALKLIDTDAPESEAPSELRHIILGWARHLYYNGKYARAAEVYSRIDTPKFPLTDAAWALYQQGNCHFYMAEYDRAGEFYTRLSTEFTESEWIKFAEAKERMIGAGI